MARVGRDGEVEGRGERGGADAIPPEGARVKAGFIAGPVYDLVFFIGAPLLGLGVIWFVVARGWHQASLTFAGRDIAPVAFFISTWTYAHLAAVAFRSHLNPTVFRRYRARMVVVPIALLVSLIVSEGAMVAAFVLAAFWDVYHTSMQNFGLGRLYDMKAGNDSRSGRLLDVWMNHFAYIGPIFFGANLLPTLEPLAQVRSLGWTLPMRFGDLILAFQAELADVVLLLALVFLGIYLVVYARLVRAGRYRLSWQKLSLLSSTALTSAVAWAWLPPFEAFFAVNFFHALQYFGLVWWIERDTIRSALGARRVVLGSATAVAGYVALLFLLGVGYSIGNLSGLRWAIALGLVVSLMHFWSDGFIWSVSRREVAV